MGRKCCVPNCKSAYKSQPKEDCVTYHKFRVEWKDKIHRGGDWNITNHSFICSKHFQDSDLVYDTLDSNNRRKRKLQKGDLKYRYVKENAFPTIFPNCPKYLSKKKLSARPLLGSSLARAETSAKRERNQTIA